MVAFRLSWRIPGLEMFHFIELQWGKESLMIYPPVHVSLGAFVMPGTVPAISFAALAGLGWAARERSVVLPYCFRQAGPKSVLGPRRGYSRASVGGVVALVAP